MIVPAVLYVAVLAFYPAVNAVYGSFFTRLGNFGLYNYNFVLSQYGTQPIVNTFIVTGSALLLQFTVAFLIATLLSKPFRGRSLFSAIFLIPFGVATIVTAVIFYHMFVIPASRIKVTIGVFFHESASIRTKTELEKVPVQLTELTPIRRKNELTYPP